MPTAKKLPSGSWRCRVYSHTDASGKRIYKSFTCQDPSPKGKRICEAEASAWAQEKENDIETRKNMTFREAANEYIMLRENVLSPTTINGYQSIMRTALDPLLNINVNNITNRDIQNHINQYSQNHSPKTVRNMSGFITAVMSEARPAFAIRTKLPPKKQTNLYVPSESDVKRLLEASRGTMLELPILLAAFGPMRRGEICALRSEHINGNVVHVCQSMAKKSVNGKDEWIIKQPKSLAGDRFITFPDFVIERLQGIDGYICPSTPNAVTNAFVRLVKREGLEHFRFHDLRHYSASMQHALGVPDQYVMQRGGWGSDATLKKVYRHSVEERTKFETEKINNYFSLYDTKYDTK